MADEAIREESFRELTARCILKGGDVDLEAYIEWWEEFHQRLRFLSPFVDFAWDNIRKKLNVLKDRQEHCDNREAYTTIWNLVSFETGPGPHTPANIFQHTKEGSEAVAALQNAFGFVLRFVDLYASRRDRQSEEQREIKNIEENELKTQEQREIKDREQGEIMSQEEDETASRRDRQNKEQREIKSQDEGDIKSQEQREIKNREQRETKNGEQGEIKNKEERELKNQEETDTGSSKEQREMNTQEQREIKSKKQREMKDKEQGEDDSQEQRDVKNQEQREIKSQDEREKKSKEGEMKNEEQKEITSQEQGKIENQEQDVIKSQEQTDIKNQEQRQMANREQTDTKNQEQSYVKTKEQSEMENVDPTGCDLRTLLTDVYKRTVKKDTKWADAGKARAAIQALPLTLHPDFIISEAGLEEDVIAMVRQMHDFIQEILCWYGIRTKASKRQDVTERIAP